MSGQLLPFGLTHVLRGLHYGQLSRLTLWSRRRFKIYAFIYCTIKKFNTRLYNDAAREQANFCKAMPRSNDNHSHNNKWNYKYIDINTTTATDNNNTNHRNNKQVEVIILNR